MDKRVCNSIIIGIILFLVILLIKPNKQNEFKQNEFKQNEFFEAESSKSHDNLNQINDVLNKNKDELIKLEKDLENQQIDLDTYIKQNDKIIIQLNAQIELHQKLMNQNNNLSNKSISNILTLAKKRGIKNIAQIVDSLIKQNEDV
jgi:wobble nucleotide-excising tRNase